MKRNDLVGKRFGHLVVKSMEYCKHTKCTCVCDCGNETIKTSEYLKSSNNPSCGCKTSFYKSLNNMTDETGKRYGRLTIQRILRDSSPTKAECLCDCGNIIVVAKADVVAGHTQSCGCLQAERVSESNTKDFSKEISKHGVRFIRQHAKNNRGVWMWECICPLCEETFIALPAKVMSGVIKCCQRHSMSNNETIIELYLKQNGIAYEKQKRFSDCKHKYTLPFDFAIYNSDGEISLLIEFDGEQHYRPVEFFGGEEAFRTRTLHDQIKTEYCASRSIKLLRLSFDLTQNEIIERLQTSIIRNDCDAA